MARDQLVTFGGSGPGEEAGGGFIIHSSTGLLLLSMIIFSLSLISMIIFACGDDNSEKPRIRTGTAFLFTGGGGASNGGGGEGGGCGGGGGGGGCGGGSGC
ncbi:hypothetical protein CXB51_024786 [Gossypium anomalum]|uniref:Uncharacterized protein n=1 Tax=Gossypium anomalum TaxID=47600 RepID=A0A8J6CQ78_9ROSI|nr:hypothetical protein CXB51_024786 [Gossypium anomalum]